MIVYAILKGLLSIINFLFGDLSFPSIDDSVYDMLDSVKVWFVRGAGVLYNFVWPDIVRTLVVLFFVVDASYLLYLFVLWLLRKFGIG